jgi:hypothetical protein
VPLIEMSEEDFVRPVRLAMTTQFITGTAAGRVMKRQESGVILSLTATPGGIGYPHVGGFGPACCAIESFSRDLASERPSWDPSGFGSSTSARRAPPILECSARRWSTTASGRSKPDDSRGRCQSRNVCCIRR